MLGYFLLQWGSTLAALLVLAAAGGWALWPFRSKERPYLWLAAPLAGLAVFSLSLTGLFHVCRLTLPWAFGVTLALNTGATLAALRQAGWPGRPVRGRLYGLAALCLVTAISTGVVQESALRRGEPTIVVVGGSDQFGYAHVGDWIVRRPHQPPQLSSERPYESWVEIMQSDPRYGAFLLAALAGWVRGTTTLFSYDWAIGVALSAGLLGLAGAFARRPLPFVLLLAGGAVSVWLRNSRTGYFGRTLAYPGYLLLTHLFLHGWRGTTGQRVFCLAVLGTGFALCLSPLSLLALFVLLGLGIAGARLAVAARARLRGEPSPVPEPGRLGKGAALALAVVAPACLIAPWQFRDLLFRSPPRLGGQPTREYVLAEALDVSINWEPNDGPGKLRPYLLLAAAACTAAGFLWAVAHRAVVAAGLLLCSGAVIAGLTPERAWSVYQLQGLLYPLALAGGLLLLQQATIRQSRWRLLAAWGLVLALAASRTPQLRGTIKQVTRLKPGIPGFIARSHITPLVERVRGSTVDVCHHEVCACLALLVELGARGVRLQLRPPAWQLLTGYRRWMPPQYPGPGKYLLTAWPSGTYPADEAFVCPLWGLVPTEGAWISQVRPPQGLGRDQQRGYFFPVASDRAEIELSNGTGAVLDIDFVASAEVLPGPNDPGKRTLAWELAGRSGRLEWAPSGREVRIPLRLPPGAHQLKLRVEQPPGAATGGGALGVLLSQLGLRTVRGGFERSEAR